MYRNWARWLGLGFTPEAAHPSPTPPTPTPASYTPSLVRQDSKVSFHRCSATCVHHEWEEDDDEEDDSFPVSPDMGPISGSPITIPLELSFTLDGKPDMVDFDIGVAASNGRREREQEEEKESEDIPGSPRKRQKVFTATTVTSEVLSGSTDSSSESASLPPRSPGSSPTRGPAVYKLVLTGGPCAGKSTSITRVTSFLRNRGFFVINIEETSTFLKRAGVDFTLSAPGAFQKAIVQTQYQHEDAWTKYATEVSKSMNRPAVILMDRALLDGSVYVSPQEFQDCLSSCNINHTIESLISRYDAVFHLVTAADGAESFYITDHIRKEPSSVAIELDCKLQKAWAKHPNHFIFHNTSSFEDKLQRLVHRICLCLGVPDTFRKPKRFLVEKMPSQSSLPPGAVQFAVTKIYLLGAPNQSRGPGEFTFIRRRSDKKDPSKSQYVIKIVTEQEGQKIEKKRALTKEEFHRYRQWADPNRHVVRQNRICLTYKGSYFEICKYTHPAKKFVLLNVHQGTDQEEIAFPPFITVIPGEVTKEKSLSSHSLSIIKKQAAIH